MEEIKWIPALIVLGGYLFTFITSTFLIHWIIKIPKAPQEEAKSLRKAGNIIGKCENFLIITFILADALTGLALIFTAKSLSRKTKEDDANNELTNYFLAGTLLNFSYSLLMGFVLKYIWQLCIW